MAFYRVFPWFSHGFPHEITIFPWFSHGFPVVFPWFSRGFPAMKRWRSLHVPRCSKAAESAITTLTSVTVESVGTPVISWWIFEGGFRDFSSQTMGISRGFHGGFFESSGISRKFLWDFSISWWISWWISMMEKNDGISMT